MPITAVYFLFGLVPILLLSIAILSNSLLSDIRLSWIWFILVMILIDFVHIFVTFPVYLNRSKALFPKIKTRLIIPIFVILLTMLASVFCTRYFLFIVAYVTLLHIARQQGGILKSLLRKDQTSFPNVHLTAYWIIFLIPLLHLHSSASLFAPYYFTTGDMIRPLPGELMAWVHKVLPPLFLIYFFVFLFGFFKLKKISKHILVMQFGTFLWFYGGWCLLPQSVFYFSMAPILHGASYIFFSIEAQDSFLRESSDNKKRTHLYYVISTLGAVLVWMFIREELIRNSTDLYLNLYSKIFWGLLWAPGMVHAFLDTFIWRSSVVQKSLAH